MVEMNHTERAATVATFMQEELFESHRGAARWRGFDTKQTTCIALYGNDCYSGDRNPDRQARTTAYVHGLYAGWSNLLPEGAVEFGTTSDGYTWAILLHLPKPVGKRSSVRLLLRDLVWGLWQANLSLYDCTSVKGGSR